MATMPLKTEPGELSSGDQADERPVVLDVEGGRPFAGPVTFAAMRADPGFSGFALVRRGG